MTLHRKRREEGLPRVKLDAAVILKTYFEKNQSTDKRENMQNTSQQFFVVFLSLVQELRNSRVKLKTCADGVARKRGRGGVGYLSDSENNRMVCIRLQRADNRSVIFGDDR